MQNTYVPKFTYVIPFRFSHDRIINLRRVVDWLSGFQGVEVMVVEQDKHSKISHLSIKANHIFIKSEAPFNKSWAYNVAIRRSNSPILIFGDCDFIMDPMCMIECLKSLDNFDCVIPTDSIYRLDQMESTQDTGNIIRLQQDLGKPNDKQNLCDGISVFKRESLMRIGCWNEDFFGTGFENKFQDMKITKMLNYKQFNYRGFRLFSHGESLEGSLMKRNEQIIDYYVKNSDVSVLQNHISTTIPKIGQLNKYQ